jgi:hypothetical protein
MIQLLHVFFDQACCASPFLACQSGLVVNCSEIGKYTRIVTPTITRELRHTHSHNPRPRSNEPYTMKVPFSGPYPIPSHIPISFPLMLIIISINDCLAVVIIELDLIQTNMFNLHIVVI